ncbi:SDR family NAD(P)-dependent oxidoreductase [Micromonospora wenchangensis]|uniref:SDR family NAD(P)-dependent oxidoreductase n=1 Tax=Micromonospora wenchangensis TaxID=1185415 RepID=UPI00380A7DBF
MGTVVITGGTDGIGGGLARACLDRGDRIVVVGRDEAKGRALVAADGGTAATFIAADLSLVSENRRVVAEIAQRFPVVDAVVLCARFYHSRRTVTSEGFEHTFALLYLSRFLLGEGLLDNLERADQPVIVNVAGPGPNPVDVHWDDVQLAHDYDGTTALMQSGRLNNLLGAGFVPRHPAARTRYVLVNPGSTATSFAGEYDASVAAHIESMKRFGKPVAQSVAPIARVIESPPREPLSAFVEGGRIGVDDAAFAPADAARLHDLTEGLLSALAVPREA